jgi:DNA-binding response OmpR family regulator
MRLLIVEDDPVLSALWADLFTDAGAHVLGPYASASGALTVVTAPACDNGIDAALLDIQVRDGDSYPVAHALRAIGVPFVFLSGSDPEDLPDEFKGAPFLHKPIAARDVFAALGGLPHRS